MSKTHITREQKRSIALSAACRYMYHADSVVRSAPSLAGPNDPTIKHCPFDKQHAEDLVWWAMVLQLGENRADRVSYKVSQAIVADAQAMHRTNVTLESATNAVTRKYQPMPKISTTRVGSTLYVHDDSQEAAKVLNAAIVPDGFAAIRRDGTAEWVCDEPIIDTSKSGSAQYIWNKVGSKVKHARVRYRKDAAGVITKTTECHVYKVF